MRTSVTLFFRKPRASYFSIEGLFRAIMQRLPEDIEAVRYECPYISGGLFKRLGNLWCARKAQGAVNHITGDVHYLAMGLDPKRTILTVHDAAMLDRLKGWRRAIYKFFWFDWPLRRVALVTVISEATRSHLLKNTNVSPEIVHVISDCISETFKEVPRIFNAEKPRILQIGTKKNKNIERVAQALEGVPCELRVIGKLTEAQEAALVTAKVDFSSASNLSEAELVAEYQECDILIFVSTIEGFGMPILEAQVTGRVVVTSHCSSMPEVAGEGAQYVDPLNVQSIREGVVRVATDPVYRATLIAAGQQNANKYSAAIIAEQYAALYRQVAQQN